MFPSESSMPYDALVPDDPPNLVTTNLRVAA